MIVGPAGFGAGRGFGAGFTAPGLVCGRGFGVVAGREGAVVGGSGAVVGACVAVATGGVVATITERPASWCPREVAIATAAPAAAITSPSSAGQIQSPGYQGSRLCHAWPSAGTTPRWIGRRRPHSRQYSCWCAYGVPQRGHAPAAAGAP